MQHWFTHLGLRAQIEDPNNEAQHIKLLHQPNALLISFKGLNALSVPRLEAEISAYEQQWIVAVCELCVNGGELWVELHEVRPLAAVTDTSEQNINQALSLEAV